MEDNELKPTQLWGPEGPTIWVGKRDQVPGYVPVSFPKKPSSGSSFLRDQLASFTREISADEYAAGFRARLAEIPAGEHAHPSWRAGWEDADTELLEEARHQRWLEEGREDSYLGTGRLLYDAGGTARENGILFDEGRTEPWKAGWIATDIQIGAKPAL